MSDKPKRNMSPETLAKLAEARKKANEVRSKMAAIKKAQKAQDMEEIEKKYDEMVLKKQPAAAKPQEPEPVVEEQPKEVKAKKPAAKKKVVKKVIEVSDSSSDDDTESESDDEPTVEYVVRRSKRGGKASSRSQRAPVEYDTPRLSAEVARNMLKEKVMNDAQMSAWKSLFPYHNF